MKEDTIFEDFIQLVTPQQKEIFDNVKTEWEKKVGKGKISEGKLKRIILMADTNLDGKKRVVSMRTGKTHLVPIDDVILHGLREEELDKYPIG